MNQLPPIKNKQNQIQMQPPAPVQQSTPVLPVQPVTKEQPTTVIPVQPVTTSQQILQKQTNSSLQQ